jgi:hypothetical protein
LFGKNLVARKKSEKQLDVLLEATFDGWIFFGWK